MSLKKFIEKLTDNDADNLIAILEQDLNETIEFLKKEYTGKNLENHITNERQRYYEYTEFTNKQQKVIYLLRWSYFSKSRKGFNNFLKKQTSKIFKEEYVEKEYPLPTYEDLLIKTCKKVKAYDEKAKIEELEKYLIETVMITSLAYMKPKDRHRTLTETFDPSYISNQLKIKNGHSVPITLLSTIALANISGFGVFLAATATLGMVTSTLGVTLPFAAYAGLTTILSFIIGPVGWIGAGIWTFFSLTGIKWKKIIPAMVYLISVKYREEGEKMLTL